MGYIVDRSLDSRRV